MKRTWIIILVVLGIIVISPAIWAEKPDCDIAGAWVAVTPPVYIYTSPMWAHMAITPTDPTGKRLIGTMQVVNGVVNFNEPGGTGAGVQTYVRSGKGTYQITWIFAFSKDNWPQRGIITGIQTYSGTVECTSADSLAISGILSFYDPSQDQDGDGLPDPGQVPFNKGPWGWTAVRLPLMAP